MKTERLLALVVLLLSRKQVTAKEMAQHFQVSKRTIYRDMITLENAGFPIFALHGNEGGYQLMDGFKLHSYTFSEEEKAWLIKALDLQTELLTETAVGRGISDKLRLLVTEPATPHLSIEQSTLHRKQIEDEAKEKLSLLERLMEKERKIRISYVSANGQQTTRIINPWQLRLTNGSWYLLAYCELRQEERAFKLTRIRDIMTLDERRLAPSLKQRVEQLAQQEVVCLFSAQELGKLFDFFTEEDMRVLANGDILVSFEEDREKNLVPFLLMFGPSVKVLAPEILRQAHIQAIDRMANNYLD